MLIEVKHALSGHSSQVQLDPVAPSHRLMLLIQKNYVVDTRDQVVVTKCGRLVREDSPVGEIFEKEGQDRTYARGFEGIEGEKHPAVFVFNRKELEKEGERQLAKSRGYWIDSLRENAIPIQKSEELLPLVYPAGVAEVSSEPWRGMKERVQSIGNAYQKLSLEYKELENYCMMIENIADKCSNQKKATHALKRNVAHETARLNSELAQSRKLLEELKKSGASFDDRSLRENSSFFERRRKSEDQVGELEGQLEQLFGAARQSMNGFKETRKEWSGYFKEKEERLREFTQKEWKAEIKAILQANEGKLSALQGDLTAAIERKDLIAAKQVERRIELYEGELKDGQPQFEGILQELVDSYMSFNELNQRFKQNVKMVFKEFTSFVRRLKEDRKKIERIRKELRKELEKERQTRERAVTNKENKDVSQFFEKASEVSGRTEEELKRRIVFNRKMNFLLSLGDKLTAHQQQQRKAFAQEGDCDIPYLRDERAPSLELDLEYCSDRQVILEMRSREGPNGAEECTVEEFVAWQYNEVMGLVRETVGAELSKKLKNMEEVVVRMGEIFAKVYNRKVEGLLQDKEKLEAKVAQLTDESQGKNKANEQKQSQLQKQIQQLTAQLSKKQELMLQRQQQRAQQMNKQHAKWQQLSRNYKTVSKDLQGQALANEQLLEELEKLMRENEEVKEMLASKEVQIIRMEEQMSQPTKAVPQVTQEVTNSLQIDLKNQVVVEEMALQIKKEELSHEIVEELKSQVEALQSENQRLEEENLELNAQLRKIFCSAEETQDDSTQTDPTSLPSSKSTAVSESTSTVVIPTCLSVGDRALFMPFSSGCYVAVTAPSDKTISMDQAHTLNYFLDLNEQPVLTRQFLTQCSCVATVSVSRLKKEGSVFLVEGSIDGLFGFEDDSPEIKDYAHRLPH